MSRAILGNYFFAFLIIGVSAIGASGCREQGGRPSTLVSDNVDLQVVFPNDGSTVSRITIPVTLNDDAGSRVVVTSNGPNGPTFELQEQSWGRIEIGTPPRNGTATPANLDVVYKTTAFSGIDKFTYKAFLKNSDEEAGEVEVTVNILGSAAVANDDGPFVLRTSGSDVLDIDVLQNDAGKNIDTKIIDVTQPTLGTVTISSSNDKVTYTPSYDFQGNASTGLDEFHYSITGGSSAKVTVVVKETNIVIFSNGSENPVQFKVDGTLVTDTTGQTLLVRPHQNLQGFFPKGSQQMVTAETVPQVSAAVGKVVDEIRQSGRFIYSEIPVPTITYTEFL